MFEIVIIIEMWDGFNGFVICEICEKTIFVFDIWENQSIVFLRFEIDSLFDMIFCFPVKKFDNLLKYNTEKSSKQ